MTYPPIKMKAKCHCFSKFRRSIAKVRKDAPIVLEVLIAVTILCVLLIVDVIWLGATHRKEIQLILDDHNNDVSNFKKQFDAQIHQVNQLHEKEGNKLLDKHSQDVGKIKVQHQQELERKISSIQKELNNLLGLSKEYWEKHELEMAHEHGTENGQNGR